MRIGAVERGVLTIDLEPDGGELCIRVPGGRILIGALPTGASVVVERQKAQYELHGAEPTRDDAGAVVRMRTYLSLQPPSQQPPAHEIVSVMLSEGWLGTREQMAGGERRAPDGTVHPVQPARPAVSPVTPEE